MNFNLHFLNLTKETKVIVKHIGLAFLYKSGAILITFLMVPLSIEYLGSEKYGLWLTIFSFIGWFNFFDFGIGQGLRNRLTETWAKNKIEAAKTYVSTTYFSIVIIISLAMLLLVVCFPLIAWEKVFKTDVQSIRKIVLIAYLLFFTNMLLGLVGAIFLADQKSSIPGLMNFVAQIFAFAGIYFLISYKGQSILYYALIVMGSQSLVYLFASAVAFKFKYSSIKPEIKYFDKNVFNDLFKVSGSFFFIQIAGTLLFATDNFIINYFFGSENVTVYNIAFKYFMLPIVVVNIITHPYWSAFTEAQAKKNDKWIKDSLSNLLKISSIAAFGTIFMIFFADIFYSFWVGDAVKIPFIISFLIGINTILQIMLEPLIMLINGIGKLRIQLYTALISALFNIPLSLFLGITLNFGMSGVIIASTVSSLIGFVVYPVQVGKILNKSASGIWNS